MTKGEGKKKGSVADSTKLALYRKYRPTSLDQVIGQSQVTDVLQAAAKSGSFAHAYLFTGQRGTGKTTVARILAHLINNLEYQDNINSGCVDIIEIDAASNNGVDDVREIRDSVQLAPMGCSHKVYIIDEFHMLSKPAFNALLKTIEEPPEYVVFILATTELQKVPATILSRVQRFHFRPLPAEQLAKHLRMIADNEKIVVDDEALLRIAEYGGGSVRDSITLLDQLSCRSKITVQDVTDVLGLVSGQTIDQLIDATLAGNMTDVVTRVGQIIGDGTSPTALAEQLIRGLEGRAVHDNTPGLYQLIDQLLAVAKSSLPQTKLVATLINYAQPTFDPATARPAVASRQVATNNVQSSTGMDSATIANKSVATTANVSSTPINDTKPVVDAPASKPTSEPSPQPATTNNASQSTTISSDNPPIAELVWEDVLQQLADQDRPSTRSLLQQCDYRYSQDSNTLTLFFGRSFHRKQAKTASFNNTLLTTIEELYHTKPVIEISDEEAPADSDVAAVLKLVGGEVTNIIDGTI